MKYYLPSFSFLFFRIPTVTFGEEESLLDEQPDEQLE